MDRRLLFALPGVLILIVVVVAIWFVIRAKPQASPVVPWTATTTAATPDLSGQSIYTNGPYGFSIVYPGTAKLQNVFSSFYHVPNTWRVNALPNATGAPLVAIVAYSTTSDHSYPRYFDAEVRISASVDPFEINTCEKAGDNETEEFDTKIGTATFKTFSFSGAGMMQYVNGVSYRTIHEGKCFVIEKFETGSSYRDNPASSADISESTLSEQYRSLDAIVESFSFARP